MEGSTIRHEVTAHILIQRIVVSAVNISEDFELINGTKILPFDWNATTSNNQLNNTYWTDINLNNADWVDKSLSIDVPIWIKILADEEWIPPPPAKG